MCVWGRGESACTCVYYEFLKDKISTYVCNIILSVFHHEAVTNKPKGGPNCNIHFLLSRKLFEILHLSGFGDFASFQSASVPQPAAQQQQQQASLLMGGGGGGGPPPPAFQPQQQVMQQQQQQPSFADFGSFQASGAAATAQASGVAMAQVWLVQNCSWYIYLVDNGSVIIMAIFITFPSCRRRLVVGGVTSSPLSRRPGVPLYSSPN